jgi:hypothetical protein
MAKTLTTAIAESDSIEVSRNVKGEYSVSVKVYFEGSETSAQEKVERIINWFNQNFRKEA